MATKKVNNPKLEAILNEVGLPYFLMAVSHLIDVGYRHMDEESVKETIEGIKAREQDPLAIMSNDFMIFLVETAYKISQAAEILEMVKFASQYITL
jgi:hypothetical protein